MINIVLTTYYKLDKKKPINYAFCYDRDVFQIIFIAHTFYGRSEGIVYIHQRSVFQ